MKVPAPPPPQAPHPAPRHLFRNSVPDGGGTSAMDVKENILRPTVTATLSLLCLLLSPSKALMDLLVDLCGRHHLNPSLHTLELLSPEGHSLGFKANALLGSFDVACVLIKEKVVEERVTRRPAPKVPEKTVRLMVNFHGNQKAVVRVNPLVPLQALIPAVCDKCDFDPAHVLLLKDGISRHELPPDKSLTELGIRELYAHDQSLGKRLAQPTRLLMWSRVFTTVVSVTNQPRMQPRLTHAGILSFIWHLKTLVQCCVSTVRQILHYITTIITQVTYQ
uniref:Cordon-bleu WH2 repeat protein n=1 Tax=Fundulus heteroclitus TaxID=8078 RepID=A0A3Q2QAA6_FUNHE